jgi:hypothetical protein
MAQEPSKGELASHPNFRGRCPRPAQNRTDMNVPTSENPTLR